MQKFDDMYICIHTHIHTYVYTFIHISTHLNLHTHICTRIYTYMCVHIMPKFHVPHLSRACMYIYMYTNIRVYIYMSVTSHVVQSFLAIIVCVRCYMYLCVWHTSRVYLLFIHISHITCCSIFPFYTGKGSKSKASMVFMQKYHHKGAFFMENDEANLVYTHPSLFLFFSFFRFIIVIFPHGKWWDEIGMHYCSTTVYLNFFCICTSKG